MIPPERLDAVCNITMGQAPDGESYNTTHSGVPLIAGAGDFQDGRPATKKFTTQPGKLCEAGDIVLGIRASIGDKVTADGVYCLGRGVAGLRPRERLHSRYLWHWLTQTAPLLIGKAKGATFKQVNREDIAELSITLPPLDEQRRIATILDKADDLRAKRRAAIAQLDTLTQSIFLDMFGDPVSNPKGWPRVPFSRILEEIDSGWSPVCLDRPAVKGGWGVLKLGAVTRCEYDPSENKALPFDVDPIRAHEVKQGDLLFTRKNTHDLVGACALVRATPSRLLLPDLIFRLRLRNDAEVDSTYLQQLLVFPSKRREVQKLATGSASSMPNISKGRLATSLIELPPPALQRRFAARLDAVEQVRSLFRASLSAADLCFRALQANAFQGGL